MQIASSRMNIAVDAVSGRVLDKDANARCGGRSVAIYPLSSDVDATPVKFTFSNLLFALKQSFT
jgi:hypothetical protein